MRNKVHSLFALVMLFAFCNMMLVKDFHHHDCAVCSHCASEGTEQESDSLILTESDYCPICHFTIAPQQAQIARVAIVAPEVYVQLRCFFVESFFTIDAEEPSSRGPPAC